MPKVPNPPKADKNGGVAALLLFYESLIFSILRLCIVVNLDTQLV
jgi:hypothetical protein